jgi:hypothetical protein
VARLTLDDLVTQLRAAHGDALRAVVLYGSTAAAPDAAAGASHNVLVVVAALPLEAMRAAGAVARAWQEAGHPVILTLTEAEWRSSADVFAIEHADIVERHRVLWSSPGFNLLGSTRVDPRNIRHQLEYEALALLLRVRAGIAAAGNDKGARTGLLVAHAPQATALFRAVLRIEGTAPPVDASDLCRSVGTRAGFDPAPFEAALALRRGARRPDAASLDSTLTGFHDGLARLVAFLDAW